MDYINRIVDEEIVNKLSNSGILFIEGARGVGKSVTLERFSKSTLNIQDDDNLENYILLASTKPSLLLKGERPRLIDEWQVISKIFVPIKFFVDKIGGNSQYILTSSMMKKFDNCFEKEIRNYPSIKMRTMTLFESGDSNGSISLKRLLDGYRDIEGNKSKLTYKDIAFILCRGGFPNSINLSKEKSLEFIKKYVDNLCNNDISKVDDVKRNSTIAKEILKSYSKMISTTDSNKSLFSDVQNSHSVSDRTIIDYLEAFKRLYIIDEIKAWKPNIRTSTSIRTTPKKNLIDPSIAICALNYSLNDIMFDVKKFNMLFKNLVYRDLSVYAESLGATIMYYKDRYNLECDFVLKFDNNRYIFINAVLVNSLIDDAVDKLIKLKDLVTSSKENIGSILFMMVLTGGDSSYVTKEGVLVVPVGCFRN